MRSVFRAIADILAVMALFLSVQTGIAGDNRQANAEPPKNRVFNLDDEVEMEFVLIAAGSFSMGNSQGKDNEKPVHQVKITRPFYLGKYEVTQRQWETLMGRHRSTFKGPENPVENVSWKDCQIFLGKLNRKLRATRVRFRLPTEAQWEYACRAGSPGVYCFGDAEENLGEYAWFNDNADCKTQPVGQKKPNAWGLYDMHGNVFEWCADWFGACYYAQSPPCDPTGPCSGTARVIRGGGWSGLAPVCRAAYRPSLFTPTARNSIIGFRVACEAKPSCKP